MLGVAGIAEAIDQFIGAGEAELAANLALDVAIVISRSSPNRSTTSSTIGSDAKLFPSAGPVRSQDRVAFGGASVEEDLRDA